MSLERNLGVRLFDRVGRDGAPDRGRREELVVRAGPLLDELSRVTFSRENSDSATAGRVRLGAERARARERDSAGDSAHFAQANRRVDLRLIDRTTERLPEMVAAERERLMTDAETSIEYERRPGRAHPGDLWEEELVLVLPMGQATRARPRRRRMSYRTEDFILRLPPARITRRLLDRELAEKGVELMMMIVLEHQSPEVIKAMVFDEIAAPSPNKTSDERAEDAPAGDREAEARVATNGSMRRRRVDPAARARGEEEKR